MRCPKCGYITFDLLSTCTKCRKKIAATSEQLSGTVFKAEAPAFLQFKNLEPGAENEASADLLQEENDIDVEFSLDGEEGVMDNSSANDDIEFDFLDEGQDAPASLSNEGEESVELDLNAGDTDVAGDKDGPQLDFSELDISDLAPPAADEDDLSSAELTLEDASGAPVARAKDYGQTTMGSGGQLEDLQLDGLDLEIPIQPPAGSTMGKKMRPAVKTGTALDGFDIDLGELMSGQEK